MRLINLGTIQLIGLRTAMTFEEFCKSYFEIVALRVALTITKEENKDGYKSRIEELNKLIKEYKDSKEH